MFHSSVDNLVHHQHCNSPFWSLRITLEFKNLLLRHEANMCFWKRLIAWTWVVSNLVLLLSYTCLVSKVIIRGEIPRSIPHGISSCIMTRVSSHVIFKIDHKTTTTNKHTSSGYCCCIMKRRQSHLNSLCHVHAIWTQFLLCNLHE